MGPARVQLAVDKGVAIVARAMLEALEHAEGGKGISS